MNVERLHQEHTEWLSDVKHWERELEFLTSLIDKIRKRGISESLQKATGEYENNIRHHESRLGGMKIEIVSHESFIKDMVDEDPETLENHDLSDHNQHRERMRNFKRSFKELKHDVFQLAEEVL